MTALLLGHEDYPDLWKLDLLRTLQTFSPSRSAVTPQSLLACTGQVSGYPLAFKLTRWHYSMESTLDGAAAFHYPAAASCLTE